MSMNRALAAFATVMLTMVSVEPAAAQLMSTCAEDSPERRGELGCTVVATTALPRLAEPVFWHIDRFPSLERARAAAGPASVALDAAERRGC